MSIKDLVPRFRRTRHSLPVHRDESDLFRDFQREMNRLFDDFFDEAPVVAGENPSEWVPAAFVPRVDVSETDKEVRVSAELPGMDEKDITVELQDNLLTLRGEKKTEQEEKGENWFRREQACGSFQRSVQLPAGVDASRASAQFRKGVLVVTAPKREEEQEPRQTVTIQTE